MVGQYLPTWRPGQDYRQSYSASRGKGGGALLDLSHEIDYLQWLFGVLDPSAGLVGKVSDLEIDSDDLALALGRTRAGTAVSLSLDYLSRIPIRRLVVHTARKTLVGDLVAGTLEVASDAMAPSKRTLDASDRNLTYRRMHEALLDASGRDCCTLQEGLEVLAVVERIRKTEVTS
jgi:CMP-N,N'-diacetyllegionaminic acid synthase